jgi:hypothetical protein
LLLLLACLRMHVFSVLVSLSVLMERVRALGKRTFQDFRMNSKGRIFTRRDSCLHINHKMQLRAGNCSEADPDDESYKWQYHAVGRWNIMGTCERSAETHSHTHTHTHADRQTDRQTHTHTHTHMLTPFQPSLTR